jgi:hypothetical protein
MACGHFSDSGFVAAGKKRGLFDDEEGRLRMANASPTG